MPIGKIILITSKSKIIIVVINIIATTINKNNTMYK